MKLSFDYEAEIKVIKSIKKQYGNLVNETREESKKFRGQTPLHIAITKGVHNHKVLQYLIPKDMNYVLSQNDLGSKFHNTVMMAELPLSVAALKCVSSNKTAEDLKNDQNIFKTLILKCGSRLDGENKHGDNVCHSLIRYILICSALSIKCTNYLDVIEYTIMFSFIFAATAIKVS